MRLSRIYTKVGDKGTTALADGSRVAKDDARIEAYGAVDELNAVIGAWRDALRGVAALAELDAAAATIQNEMHDLGGELATPAAALDVTRQQVVTAEAVHRLEAEMDRYNADLPPLANFVLPGGHPANSGAHLCRTVCRRAERRVLTLARAAPVREEARIYLNRLSDWFFVAGRVAAARVGVAEVLWRQARRAQPPGGTPP